MLPNKVTDSRIYLQTAIACLIVSVIAYCLPMLHFAWEDTIVNEQGATMFDVVYFNADKLVHFTVFAAVSYLCFWIDAIMPYNLLINQLKYFSLGLTGISLVRLVFHFFVYAKIGWIECVIYGLVIMIGLYKYIKVRNFITNGNSNIGHN